jgi:hypothetical protein
MSGDVRGHAADVWGSRGREFKSRQPDTVWPNESQFRSKNLRPGGLNVATGVAAGAVTTGKPLRAARRPLAAAAGSRGCKCLR